MTLSLTLSVEKIVSKFFFCYFLCRLLSGFAVYSHVTSAYHKNENSANQIRNSENWMWKWSFAMEQKNKKKTNHIKYVASFANGVKSRSFCVHLFLASLALVYPLSQSHTSTLCWSHFQHHHFDVVMCLFSKIVSIIFFGHKGNKFQQMVRNAHGKDIKSRIEKKEIEEQRTHAIITPLLL